MAGFSSNDLPNETSIRIGKNISVLRSYRRETQEHLAGKIRVCKSYIGHWENGKRLPTAANLEAIADYYGISVEMLTTEKISFQTLDELLNTVSFEKYYDMGVKIFKRFTSPAGKNNADFCRAEELYHRLFNLNDETTTITMMKTCRTYYYNSFKNENILAGAANTIMMLLYEYASMDTSNELLVKLANNKASELELGRFYTAWKRNPSKERKKFIHYNEPIYDECLKALRNDPQTLSIAEYYLVLKYFMGFVELRSDFTINDCEKIADVLFSEFYSYDNPHVLDLYNMFEGDS